MFRHTSPYPKGRGGSHHEIQQYKRRIYIVQHRTENTLRTAGNRPNLLYSSQPSKPHIARLIITTYITETNQKRTLNRAYIPTILHNVHRQNYVRSPGKTRDSQR